MLQMSYLAEDPSHTKNLSDDETTAELSSNDCDKNETEKGANSEFFLKAQGYFVKLQQMIDESILDNIEPLSKVTIPPISCMFLRVQRGDVPLSPIRFPLRNTNQTQYNIWFEKIILRDPKNKEICEKAGILRAMHCSTLLRVHKDSKDLRSLFQRWNTKRHTFVTAWGHMTPTLLDVNEILGLNILGTRIFDEGSLSTEESNIVDDLTKAFNNHDESFAPATKRNLRSTWIRYWLGEFDEAKNDYVGSIAESKSQLAALIVFWLSEYIFEGPPSAGIAKRLFSVAACLATGSQLPLAPMFLGSLYKRLDELVFFMEQSMGNDFVVSYINVPFMYIWLYEHIPNCAPTPNQLDPSPLSHPLKYCHRAERWINVATSEPKQWNDYIDDIEEICFRPYGQHCEYTFPNIVIAFIDKSFSMLDRNQVDQAAATFACISESHWLQSIIEQEGLTSKNKMIDVEYYPSDFSYFLGLPQKLPPCFLSPNPSETKIAHLYCKGCYSAFAHLLTVAIPAFRHTFQPTFSKAYTMYLQHQLSTWEEFVKTAPVRMNNKQSDEPRKKQRSSTPPLEKDTSIFQENIVDLWDFEHQRTETIQQAPHSQPQGNSDYPYGNFSIVDQDNSFWAAQTSNTLKFSIGNLHDTSFANITDAFDSSTDVLPLQQLVDNSQQLYLLQAAEPNTNTANNLTMAGSSSMQQQTALTAAYDLSFEQNDASAPATADKIMNSILGMEPNLFQATKCPKAMLIANSLLPTLVMSLDGKTGADLNKEDITFLTTGLMKLASLNVFSHVVNRCIDEALLLYKEKTYGPQAIQHLQDSEMLAKKIQEEEADLNLMETAIQKKTEIIAQLKRTASEKKARAEQIFQELQIARSKLGYSLTMELDQRRPIKFPF